MCFGGLSGLRCVSGLGGLGVSKECLNRLLVGGLGYLNRLSGLGCFGRLYGLTGRFRRFRGLYGFVFSNRHDDLGCFKEIGCGLCSFDV